MNYYWHIYFIFRVVETVAFVLFYDGRIASSYSQLCVQTGKNIVGG
jgi:hypothetical protein